MIITISGKPGSGKSTIGLILAERLGYEFMSVGDLRGQIAQEHGLTIDQLNKIGETEKWTDEEADQKTIELGRQRDNLVLEGRLAYHFIPHSYKIFLNISDQQAAERIFKDQRSDEPQQQTVESTLRMLQARHESDKQRYQTHYGIDFMNLDNYDLIIDTTNLSRENIIDKVLDALKYI